MPITSELSTRTTATNRKEAKRLLCRLDQAIEQLRAVSLSLLSGRVSRRRATTKDNARGQIRRTLAAFQGVDRHGRTFPAQSMAVAS